MEPLVRTLASSQADSGSQDSVFGVQGSVTSLESQVRQVASLWQLDI